MLRKTLLMKRGAVLALLVIGVLLGAVWAQTETVLYSFCEQKNCTDGAEPVAGIVFDQKGNLYGTTRTGGAYQYCSDVGFGCGVVFKLTRAGKYTLLHTFCEQGGNCTDGANPYAASVLDPEGNLYGTTEYGGVHGQGVVFKLTPEGKYIVLHSFCGQSNCTDGAFLDAGLVFDQKGNLYGTTNYGGANNDSGVVFKLTPKGRETVLYNFCSQSNCADGGWPSAGLIFDQKGNLYGTTWLGGAHSSGTVFKLTPKGKETVLYSFCVGSYCPDGDEPSAGLVFDQKGNLYGTTSYGGGLSGYCTLGCGVVFKLTPKGKETVLHSFCPDGYPCADGETPTAGLVFDQKGNLFGTTSYGGSTVGVVFKLTP